MMDIVSLLNSASGRILELGASDYTTPLVHHATIRHAREAFTYDIDPQNLAPFLCYRYEKHHLQQCDDWFDVPVECHWDIVLINQVSTPARVRMLERVAWWAKYVIVESHGGTPADTDAYRKYLRHVPLIQHTPTIVLSNLLDLTSVT